MTTTNSNEITGVGRLKFVSKKNLKLDIWQSIESIEKFVGKSIVKALELYSSNNQKNHINLNVRENAILFYSKLGYKNIDEIDLGIKIKHYKMEKILEIILP